MASKRNLSILLIFVVLAGLLSAGLYRLFDLRFRAGDIYPACSTFRADPKGAKILFQSLEELPGVSVERKLRPQNRLDGTGTTLIYLGGNSHSLFRTLDQDLSPFLLSGGRAILAFRADNPIRQKKKPKTAEHENLKEENRAGSEPETADETPKDAPSDSETNSLCRDDKLINLWGIELAWFSRNDLKKKDPEESAFPESGTGFTAPIPWFSALYFDQLGEEWTVLYRYLDQPVIISRTWGKGTVILLADSYLFSNEAMVRDRHSALLATWLNDTPRIIFDEVHLGVSSQDSIMRLLNRYRLQGTLLALLLLAALFVWKNSSSFIPKYSDPAGGDDAVGTDVGSMQGFTHLLLRHLPQKQLLDAITTEWKATFSRQAAMRGKLEKLEAELRTESSLSAVERYNRLTKILNERK